MEQCCFIGFSVGVGRYGWGEMVWVILGMFGERVGVVKGILLTGKVYAGGNKGSVVCVAGAIVKAVGVCEVVEGVCYWLSTGVGYTEGVIGGAVVVHAGERSCDEW